MGLHVLVYLQIYNRMKPKFLALINKTSNTSVVQGPTDVGESADLFDSEYHCQFLLLINDIYHLATLVVANASIACKSSALITCLGGNFVWLGVPRAARFFILLP